ncbi:L-rhamnonate dehydratase [archaeon HR06]|nr:L-rhamnonate dehydratase [archaeon HR06]
MIIKDIKIYTLKTKIEEEPCVERLIRPVDIYEKFKEEKGLNWPYKKIKDKEYEVFGTFLEILTDEGISGLAGPLGAPWATLQIVTIDKILKPLLIGEDPLQIEKIWDIMYRYMVHGRKGETMMAISAIDCALWDLKGKYYKKPVSKLLGGNSRDKVRAYVSTLGYSLEPKEVTKICSKLLDDGYTAMKWFFRYGPEDGVKGEEKNLELVKTIRDIVPYKVDLMLDCWMSWNEDYTIRMAKKLERYEINWIEEPVMPDNIDGYVRIKKRSPIKIAGGEHEYTRWGFKLLLEKEALDIAQPDLLWCGGITEGLKILALTSSYSIPLIPHVSSIPITLNFLFSQNVFNCPLCEFLINWNIIAQAFFKEKIYPKKGYFFPIEKPGLGFELSEELKDENESLFNSN